MAKPTYHLLVEFKPSKYSNMYLDGFLDMLRYDNCRVESWAVDKDGVYCVVVTRDDIPFTMLRWESFGLTVTDVGMKVSA